MQGLGLRRDLRAKHCDTPVSVGFQLCELSCNRAPISQMLR